MTKLAEQTVLVTGANRGLGREFVSQLLDRGVAKVYAAARNPDMVNAADPRVVPIELDVSHPASIAQAVEFAQDVSILVNNAGISEEASVLDPDTSTLRRALDTHLFGPLALTSGLVDNIAARSGAVVNIGSIASWIGVAGSYGVSKAALWSATDSMRIELAPRGVLVVGVYFGPVDTDMTAGQLVAKSDPAVVVAQVLDAVVAGEVEVFADEVSRVVRGNLNLPIRDQVTRLTQFWT